MARRVTGSLALAGLLLSVAAGPGLTLTRCLLTGRVALSCCCAGATTDAAPAGLGDPAERCCAFQHLAAPWMSSSQVSVRAAAPALPASLPAPLAVFQPPAAAAAPPFATLFETPPRWLRAARI